MKKLISGIALGVILATGFFFAQGVQQDDFATGEKEPSILNVSSSSISF
ncbi:hypothetical protein NSQ77_05390 [Oceanobacillus sp. FSL K6-2867]